MSIIGLRLGVKLIIDLMKRKTDSRLLPVKCGRKAAVLAKADINFRAEKDSLSRSIELPNP